MNKPAQPTERSLAIAENLRNRRKELGLKQKTLAQRACVSQAIISKLENAKPDESKKLPQIAAALGWTVEQLTGDPEETTQPVPANSTKIPVFNTGNLTLKDQPGAIHSLEATDGWITMNIRRPVAASNLAIITGFGDAMTGIFNPGDPLLIDTSDVELNHGGIYFFRVGNECFIRRLQRNPDEGIKVLSENKAYATPVFLCLKLLPIHNNYYQ